MLLYLDDQCEKFLIMLAVILVEFVLKKDENYYWRVFLEQRICIEMEKKVFKYVTDDLESSSDDSDKH